MDLMEEDLHIGILRVFLGMRACARGSRMPVLVGPVEAAMKVSGRGIQEGIRLVG